LSALSRVGLGTNNFGRRLDLDRSRAVMDAALESGVTHIDTAATYGGGDSERFIGASLAGRRERAVVATKFGWGEERGGAPERIRGALEGSLERLGMDYVDILYYHRPDGVTPISETVGAMHALVDEGKVRRLGVSNVTPEQLREAAATAPVAVVQNHYNLLKRDAESDLLPVAVELGVGFVPYFPLASGLLTGKYRRGQPAPSGSRLESQNIEDESFDRVEALETFAAERGRTLHDLAIGALASQPGVVSVIAGATKPAQVRENAAAGAWVLTAEDLASLP
jgi:aryl-alcohol dehydrogenase-like predicted oxidoreductase